MILHSRASRLIGPLIVLATFAAYAPAWHGGLLWDDDHHLTSAGLRSLSGLWRIWTELGATQQYYPLVHSSFWLEHRLWGDATVGYHLTSLALHACSALLVAAILRRLSVPGAWLAAAIFALHPVHVESVAWITELKNTLSGVCYLAAALVYLRFDERRGRGAYAASLVLFVLALLAKSVTATLPVTLLALAWWRRGRLDWRRDVVPLLPMFALGAAAGLFTAWVERAIIGAEGATFHLTAVERGLVAGRAVWFYLAKLVWPATLVFSYPRWEIDAGAWPQYLYPAAVVVVAALAWTLRARTRTPLAVLVMFVAALFPALGFFNLYPFRFSFVADHFQYLASIPVIAAAAGVLTLAGRRLVAGAWGAAPGAAAMAVLASLTWAQSRQYADAETLYRTVLRDNPRSWLAHVNLGLIVLGRDLDAAAGHFQQAIRIDPGVALAHSNLGFVWQRRGRLDLATAEYARAVSLEPNLAEPHNNWCNVLAELGQPDAALRECEAALRLRPDYPEAHYNLGVVLARLGRADALPHFEAALAALPDSLDARLDYARALESAGRVGDAVAQYEDAIRRRPDAALAHNNLGGALLALGRADQAIAALSEAVRLQPEYADAQYNLANTLAGAGRYEEAIAHYRRALALKPTDAGAHNNLGAVLEHLGRVGEAAAEYREAARLRPESPEIQRNLDRVSRPPRRN